LKDHSQGNRPPKPAPWTVRYLITPTQSLVLNRRISHEHLYMAHNTEKQVQFSSQQAQVTKNQCSVN
jgi:hypothetical protein